MFSFISWFVPSIPTWLTPGAIPFHGILQGLVGACGILVLRNLLKVYLFVDAQSASDAETDRRKKNSSNGGLTEKIQFWILTVILSFVGSRVASLVVLEFSLRAISAWIKGASDPISDPLLLLVQCQFSLGCALSCSLNFLHEEAPRGWLSLILAVGLSWFLASQFSKLWQHVKTMYSIHSTQRYCGLCIGLLTTGSSILTWLSSVLILTFSVSGIAAISNINQHFLSTTEALRFWTPLTICYTLLVVYMNEARHQQPGKQVLLNTVVVRLGGLFVLLMTVGRWSDVIHVLICFIGEAACLLPSQDLLEAISQARKPDWTKEMGKIRLNLDENTLEGDKGE
ncbi:transmembrane protein 82-like [Myxocyprinus asiaticus]|uniref:transmembrane protein 82-like n=1 Tax=Myxocyprinus asiaticus TaxID=70543 RepID=UPI002222A853|nr:transmembrane protein 82-like [Myxocyprinus asiaticus]XP_051515901.1 transmembrane protein 82-like [Myxocyprinus asiaticus]